MAAAPAFSLLYFCLSVGVGSGFRLLFRRKSAKSLEKELSRTRVALIKIERELLLRQVDSKSFGMANDTHDFEESEGLIRFLSCEAYREIQYLYFSQFHAHELHILNGKHSENGPDIESTKLLSHAEYIELVYLLSLITSHKIAVQDKSMIIDKMKTFHIFKSC